MPVMFLSARPVRAATATWPEGRETADECFYPRDPCGPRRFAFRVGTIPPSLFLSARPVRAATQ